MSCHASAVARQARSCSRPTTSRRSQSGPRRSLAGQTRHRSVRVGSAGSTFVIESPRRRRGTERASVERVVSDPAEAGGSTGLSPCDGDDPVDDVLGHGGTEPVPGAAVQVERLLGERAGPCVLTPRQVGRGERGERLTLEHPEPAGPCGGQRLPGVVGGRFWAPSARWVSASAMRIWVSAMRSWFVRGRASARSCSSTCGPGSSRSRALASTLRAAGSMLWSS